MVFCYGNLIKLTQTQSLFSLKKTRISASLTGRVRNKEVSGLVGPQASFIRESDCGPHIVGFKSADLQGQGPVNYKQSVLVLPPFLAFCPSRKNLRPLRWVTHQGLGFWPNTFRTHHTANTICHLDLCIQEKICSTFPMTKCSAFLDCNLFKLRSANICRFLLSKY